MQLKPLVTYIHKRSPGFQIPACSLTPSIASVIVHPFLSKQPLRPASVYLADSLHPFHRAWANAAVNWIYSKTSGPVWCQPYLQLGRRKEVQSIAVVPSSFAAKCVSRVGLSWHRQNDRHCCGSSTHIRCMLSMCQIPWYVCSPHRWERQSPSLKNPQSWVTKN